MKLFRGVFVVVLPLIRRIGGEDLPHRHRACLVSQCWAQLHKVSACEIALAVELREMEMEK